MYRQYSYLIPLLISNNFASSQPMTFFRVSRILQVQVIGCQSISLYDNLQRRNRSQQALELYIIEGN